METMTRVLGALGVRLVAEIIGTGEGEVVGGVVMTTLAAKPAAKKAVGAKARLRGKVAPVQSAATEPAVAKAAAHYFSKGLVIQDGI